MAYLKVGDYLDRNPRIKPAGLQSSKSYSVKDLLVHAPLADQVTALKHEEGIYEKKEPLSAPKSYPLPPHSGLQYEGVYNQMKDVLNPPEGTDFQRFRNELLETSYAHAYWNYPLSKSRYQGTLPGGFDPLVSTLGKPTPSGPTVSDLLNPQKLPGQVMFEYGIGHEMYVKSHKDYVPGEPITRKYVGNYNPTAKFGVPTPSCDRRGIHVPRCIFWFNNEPFSVGSKNQTHIAVHRAQVGKCLLREEILGSVVAKDHTFGIPTVPSCVGMREIVHFDGNPCYSKQDEFDYFSHINKVRLGLQNNQEFDWKDFLGRFRFFDKAQSGVLPLSTVYEVCLTFRLNFEKPLLEMLIKRLGILHENQCVKYEQFVDLLNTKMPFPGIPVDKYATQPGKLYYDTTHAMDYKTPRSLFEDYSTAGVPCKRNDVNLPQGQINAHKESLGDETNMPSRMNPSLLTRCGLTHRDVFVPRKMKEISSLFQRMGLKIPKFISKKLYGKGLKIDNTGGVCVETYRNILEAVCSSSFLKPNAAGVIDHEAANRLLDANIDIVFPDTNVAYSIPKPKVAEGSASQIPDLP